MNVPKLRFPEFEGEWKAAKAGDGFSNSRAKGEANLPIYSVTMDRGLVRRDSLDRHMHGDAADETNLRAQAGDIVYNMMRMWQGAAGIAEQECMVSPAYVVLSPKAQTSSEFFNYRIENARMLYLLWAYSHGLTSDRLRLYFNDFARIPIRQPSLPEQKKIAAFLGVLDAKIAALRARRDGLERYKRGLMQALFSQTLRFTKPDGTAFPDWESRLFSDIAGLSKQRINPTTTSEKLPVVELENLESGSGAIVGLSGLEGQLSQKTRFKSGDVLFGKLRPYLRKFARPDFDGVCSSEIWVLRGKKVSNSFLFYLIQGSQFNQLANISAGSKMPRSDWKTIADSEFEYPSWSRALWLPISSFA